MPLAYGLVDLAKTPKPNPSQKPHPSHGSDGNSNGLVGVDRDECPDLRKDCRICHVNAVSTKIKYLYRTEVCVVGSPLSEYGEIRWCLDR